ncbi:alpha/beta fold hydrolase [Acinetobacter puyangensis]|uniref:Phospholipase/carboxylesterase n=1 Tax=Acinetobacter puyangensis TaxID=1096779 RepID=A0A240E8M9_9GAMM|nr:dienelactone hydrolase family protein [Acinetobacter puyangensis]SNX44603.1 phospholipase/carboxylesterase [Acinetobacter puyangensis]
MKKLVIMLHGVGSNGADLEPIAEFWQQQLEGLQIASPDAPFPFMHSPQAFQWFSLNGITQENRYQRIVDARAAFDQTITDILKQHEMLEQLDRVVFCGFSQGTIMSLDAIASGRWNIAGVIGLSGRLASPIEQDAALKSKILLMHGNADQVIPVQESHLAYQKFEQAGFDIKLQTFDHLGHGVNQAEIEQGGLFLNTLFDV